MYAWVIARVQDRQEFNMELVAPLPGRAKSEPTPAQLEQEAAEFMSFMGQMTGT